MGAGQSKDEVLYQEVLNGNHDAVKALRRNGASLEWVDREGRTPLILACTRGELLDMALTLLNLGANIDVYRPGTHRGTPLHHAAKRGLEKTVTLLLSRGANPMVINDAGLTPLQMARIRGHLSVVRILEEHLCLFSGMVREISGFGILETIAPNLVTKKVWAVVVPVDLSPRRAPVFELAVYQSIKVPQPKTVISLAKAELEEPKFNTPDPVLYITDKTTKTKYKFLSEQEGDKAQLERLHRACKGLRQVDVGSPNVGGSNMPLNSPVHPPEGSQVQPVLQSVSSEAASLNQTGEPSNQPMDNFHGWDTQEESHNGWGPSHGGNLPKRQTSDPTCGGWEAKQSTFNGWGPTESGPSTSKSGPSVQQTAGPSQPSAPPLPEGLLEYPSLDMGGDLAPAIQGANGPTDEKSGGMCVICWDAPAEGACVPCGHLAGCMSCLSEVKAKKWGCPVCRLPIQQIVKVYAV